MQLHRFPVSLAKVSLNLMPRAFMMRVIPIIVQRLESRQPRLFKNLCRLQPARVHLIPNDVPHALGINLGNDPISIFLLDDKPETPDASVSGSLESLIDMLEGRADGDTLFFSRDITVTGNTEIIVGLRNTLDREEIDLYGEILSLCGPFSKPAEHVVSFADHFLSRIKGRLKNIHDEMHKSSLKARENGTLS